MTIERRSKSRYPIQLRVRYQTLSRFPISGAGETLNISSSGLLVSSPDEIGAGSQLKITIEWPSLLNGTTPLQLMMTGRVVRRVGSGFAVACESYQFRTMSRNRLQTMVLDRMPVEVRLRPSAVAAG